MKHSWVKLLICIIGSCGGKRLTEWKMLIIDL
jgi:hypothetical protein